MTPALPRVAALLHHPAQHFSPGFRALAENSSIELRVFYWSTRSGGAFDPGFDRHVQWDVDLLHGYDHWSANVEGVSASGVAALWKALGRFAPGVVLSFGWAEVISIAGTAWAFSRQVPVVLYGDASWQHERRGAIGAGRAVYLRALFRIAHGAISTGTFNREFYIRRGMSPGRIVDGCCPVDVEAFARERTAVATRLSRSPLRIGFAGKLIDIKGGDEFLAGLALLSPDLDWEAVVIGDGPLRADLELLGRELGIASRVQFLGFRNQSEMPALLAGLDVLCITSYEDRRVLVATEALAAGAVVVVSTQTAIWGKGDLVQHDVTGLVYRSGDPFRLARAVETLADPTVRNRLRAHADALLPSQTPAAFASFVSRAAREAVSASARP